MAVQETVCQHHWVIDPPMGEHSNGTCRKCGELRRFTNYEAVPIFPWRRVPPHQLPVEESTPKKSA